MGRQPIIRGKRKYSLKSWVLQIITKDKPLRQKIHECTGAQEATIRLNALAGSLVFNDYNIVKIIAEHVGEPIENLFDINY